ncbi:MAG TPA: hypothetical protein VND64_24655 [Pirellulales bacterium]|nr:hypothetical protein [Pirellulales bacterium]
MTDLEWREWCEEVWPELVELASRKDSINYTALMEKVGVGGEPREFASQCLRRIANCCRASKLPMLNVLVVNKRTGKPGGGIPFVSDLGAERERVFAFDWASYPPPRFVELPGRTER